jgi:phosphoribosylanthranilate isomerase
MPTRIKICGIRRLTDARLAVELGACALGFNFFRPSRRYIAPETAREIIEQLPPFVTAVGVFADETDGEAVVLVAQQAGVAVIQLHGPRFPGPNPVLESYPLIHGVAVKADFKPADLARLKAGAFLLDTFDAAAPGGTGKTFDWKLALEAKRYGTIILAGGLTAENVGAAIQAVRPYAVDVATGVESSPGRKDPAKLRAFFAAVEEAEEEH